MLKIILDLKNKDAIAVPDGLIEDCVDEFIIDYLQEGKDKTLVLGNQLFGHYFQVAVKKGKMSRDSLKICSPKGEFIFHENMRSTSTPSDYISYFDNVLMDLI